MSNDDDSPLVLTGNQDVRVASELQRVLTERLITGVKVNIDLTNVDSIDAAVLQLLLAAKRESPTLEIAVAEESETATWFKHAGVHEKLATVVKASS